MIDILARALMTASRCEPLEETVHDSTSRDNSDAVRLLRSAEADIRPQESKAKFVRIVVYDDRVR